MRVPWHSRVVASFMPLLSLLLRPRRLLPSPGLDPQAA